MSLRPFLGLFVQPLDVGLQLGAVHAPNPAATDLYGGQLARADERIDLGYADRQVCSYVLVLLMSAGLVISVWGLAHERLVNIVSNALSNVCGSVGC